MSQFTVQAFASGLIAVVAHSPKIAIRDWTGVIQMNSGGLSGSSLQVRVQAASLEVLDELRDSDRREIHRVMNHEILETKLYPEIVYESTEVKADKLKDDLYRSQVSGTLNLHGVSNSHGFVAQVAFGSDSARAYSEFVLRQSDYNIPLASIAGGTFETAGRVEVLFLCSGSQGCVEPKPLCQD
jgi:polyisoprenoid-binding protein YceI